MTTLKRCRYAGHAAGVPGHDADVERAESNNDLDQWLAMGGSIPLAINDGDTYGLTFNYKRIGASGNAAKIRRARLSFVRLDT